MGNTCRPALGWALLTCFGQGDGNFQSQSPEQRCRQDQGPWAAFHKVPRHPVPADAPVLTRRTTRFFLSTIKFPFPLKWLFFSLIHFYFILLYFFIYFPSVSFSIWKVTWPLFPPSIFLLPLFSLGMKHRTRLKAFNGHSIGEEKSPSELY